MRVDCIVLRLGELTLKGRNRYRFEHAVLKQIRYRLRAFPKAVITQDFGRYNIELNGEPYEKIASLMANVFGIISYSPVRIAPNELEAIRDTALEMMQELPLAPKTFKVSVKRANKAFPHDSQQMNHLVGGFVLHHMKELKVDLHHPEIALRVEIRDEKTYVFCKTIPGLGGFPLGTNGKAMLMLSGGIDSPVAGWLSMRRGLQIEAVHFHSFPFTSERAKDKVIDLAKRLSEYSAGKMAVHMVPFTDIQMKLREYGQSNLQITLMRRAMYRIAQKLAEKRNAGAVVTGESLGQVASQTLASMNVIGRVAQLPVLRPLVMMDKIDIIRIAENIETYPISILPYEDCCTLFLSKSPSTNPNLRIVERIEAQMDWLQEWIDKAVEQTEFMVVSSNEKMKEDDLL